MHRILFSADQHGNIGQYEKILDHALSINARIVLFGGDLTPKDRNRRDPVGQRDFFVHHLFPVLDKFNSASNADIGLIMGNDDFQSNYDFLLNHQDQHHYQVIDDRPILLNDPATTIAGYAYVPYTHSPKGMDWDRRDLNAHTDLSHRDDIAEFGWFSDGDEKIWGSIWDHMMDHSIEDDLTDISQQDWFDPGNLILVSHAPPHKTCCDFTRNNQHVGSLALRNFIEQYQPMLTMHGHIHETVNKTGQFKESIGRTTVACAGNFHDIQHPFVLDVKIKDGETPVLNRYPL
jgi:Icc-related predicted phosphoesterase